MTFRLGAGLVAALLIGGCASGPGRSAPQSDDGRGAGSSSIAPAPGAGPIAHTFVVHARAAATGRATWAVLLPGASGLEVLGDDQHYFRAAQEFADRGLNCLVVDYKAVYRDGGSPRLGSTASKIAWATDRAIAAARAQGSIAPDDPIVLVGWSLGAEGVWECLRRTGG